MSLLLLCANTATAASGSAELPYRFYTVVDGLTQSRVIDIEQDHAGYLWFTTARGLNRFDGDDFDHYTIADGLPNNSLSALHVSHTNSVWVGDAKGSVTAIHGAQVVHTIDPLDGADSPVLDIEIVGDRRFVVVEDFGVVEISDDGTKFVSEHVAGDADTGIRDIDVVGDELWVEATTGLYRLVVGDDVSLELADASALLTQSFHEGDYYCHSAVAVVADGR